jgi:hypothetical protein
MKNTFKRRPDQQKLEEIVRSEQGTKKGRFLALFFYSAIVNSTEEEKARLVM